MLKPPSDKARKPHEWSASDLRKMHVECKKDESTTLSIPLKKAVVCPQIFQVRNLKTKSKVGITDPAHVGKLADRLDKEGELDPVLVFPISANRFVIIDGTHRRAAYDRRYRQTIPVKVFTGSLAEARVAAGRSDNAKKRLEWTSAEKSQALYQLILERLSAPSAERMTQKQCAEAADRTERLARHMEKFIQRCRGEGREVPEKWNGGSWASNDEETESCEERMVAELLEKLGALGKLSPSRASALGIALVKHTEHAAEVVAAMITEGDLQDTIVDDFQETLAGVREEAAGDAFEEVMANTASYYAMDYMKGMAAAVGAGF